MKTLNLKNLKITKNVLICLSWSTKKKLKIRNKIINDKKLCQKHIIIKNNIKMKKENIKINTNSK